MSTSTVEPVALHLRRARRTGPSGRRLAGPGDLRRCGPDGERGFDRRRVTFAGYWRCGFSEEDLRSEALVGATA
ncbi:hypothetical protein [Micromonospora sp. C81]|uniref:hypothetical protein n=1 Tax=Micromonospora sp. C81 TaxID=2824881 RepID=UPI001B39CC5E|nr:hypothetical protein [Micromonospora sp. C81]MBQ1034886.1 hypothetical protein [Micromonospora sp. C81]